LTINKTCSAAAGQSAIGLVQAQAEPHMVTGVINVGTPNWVFAAE
jgi:hypothetical protein